MSAPAPIAEASVSVVIPTYHRPALVVQAVRSALAQTLRPAEVIVVVDGRDGATTEALQQIGDPRLQVQVPPRHLGNADARNAGVAAAEGAWVAFLDDDDAWHPRKLEHQLRAARRSGEANPIVACHLLAVGEAGAFVWPRRLPRPGEPLSEYLFCRKTPFTGEGMIINSAILTTARLARTVPFTSGLRKYVDPDWLLRATARTGADVVWPEAAEPLVTWNVEEGRKRVTHRYNWRYALAWLRANQAHFTRRSYAAFVLHVVSSNAARQRAHRALLYLLAEAFRRGQPAPVDVLSHLGNFLVPDAVREPVRALFADAHRARQRKPAEAQ